MALWFQAQILKVYLTDKQKYVRMTDSFNIICFHQYNYFEEINYSLVV